MKKLCCGIDVSKDFLDYAICWDTGKQILAVSKVENSKEGIMTLINTLLKMANKDDIWVCFEHTGYYGLLLAQILQKNQITYFMVSSLDIKNSIGLTRGKNDVIDAKRITLFLATSSFRLKPTILPSEQLLKLKALLTIRRQYIKVRTQFKNAIKSLKLAGESIPLKTEINQYKKEIKRYDLLVKNIEKQISEIIKSEKSINKNYEKIIKIPGIGSIIAAYIIVFTNNFISFSDPRKFNCYCGLAPFEYTSGNSIRGRTKTSHYRNKEMKSMMFQAALTAIQHEPQLKAYYERKINEGKHFMSVRNAIACKLVYRTFAVIKRDEPYVKFAM